MQIDQVVEVSVDLGQLVLGEVFCLDVVLWVRVLMWNDNGWVSVVVSWSLEVVNLLVGVLFVSIQFEEEVLLSVRNLVCDGCSLFLREEVFET